MAEGPDETTNSTVDSEPEPSERQGSDFFRDRPSAFFAWLGAILFVAGWGVGIYNFFRLGDSTSSGFSTSPGTPLAYRLQSLIGIGTSVTLAAGVLWGVAAYLWVQLLPIAESETD
jgi:hypothetical protein